MTKCRFGVGAVFVFATVAAVWSLGGVEHSLSTNSLAELRGGQGGPGGGWAVNSWCWPYDPACTAGYESCAQWSEEGCDGGYEETELPGAWYVCQEQPFLDTECQTQGSWVQCVVGVYCMTDPETGDCVADPFLPNFPTAHSRQECTARPL
jgi:hypothetical protein